MSAACIGDRGVAKDEGVSLMVQCPREQVPEDMDGREGGAGGGERGRKGMKTLLDP